MVFHKIYVTDETRETLVFCNVLIINALLITGETVGTPISSHFVILSSRYLV